MFMQTKMQIAHAFKSNTLNNTIFPLGGNQTFSSFYTHYEIVYIVARCNAVLSTPCHMKRVYENQLHSVRGTDLRTVKLIRSTKYQSANTICHRLFIWPD